VAVADSDCQCIRRIIRSRGFGQSQQEPDHHLNLAFLGTPVTDDRALDLQGGIFENGEPLLCRNEEGHAPGMSQLERRLNIGRIKDSLDRDRLDLLMREEIHELSVDLQKSFVKGSARRSSDCAEQYGRMPGAIRLDKTVTRGFASRVNPQYSHQQAVSGSFLDDSLVNVEVGPYILDVLLVLQRIH